MKLWISLLAMALLMACGQAGSEKNEETAENGSTENLPARDTAVPAIAPGQGSCAEGYLMSKIRKGCVMISEMTILPALTDGSAASPAYLLFEDERVEVFLPTQPNSFVMRRDPGEKSSWTNGPLSLHEEGGIYRLEDDGKVLYQSLTR